MNYKTKNGIYFLGENLSLLEKTLFEDFEALLEARNFQYLSIPSTITKETYLRQGTIPLEKIIKVSDDQYLSGSAEQGILEHFTGQHIEEEQFLYAKNQCFRNEIKPYEGLLRVKEFIKIEQFVFTNKENALFQFEILLENSTDFLKKFHIKYRVVDMTEKDSGYHIKKYDIEIYTPKYGWIESHSCTYFGEEQTKRFDITGQTHTVSNTGIASPRILLPFIEE